MALKRATFFSYGTDEQCMETQKFIEDAGILLDIRDISKDPLSERELSNLIGYLDVSHFLNSLSSSYTKNGLDKKPLDRESVIKLMAEDYTLIRRPIIKSTRLVTVGCDKKKIAVMLQMNSNGNESFSNAYGRQRNNPARRESTSTNR